MMIKRKPSPLLEAWRVGGDEPPPDWLGAEGVREVLGGYGVRNASGDLFAPAGHVIVRRKPGDCYVVTPHDFAELFEVEE